MQINQEKAGAIGYMSSADQGTQPVFTFAPDEPEDGWNDARGRLRWTTLISSGRTPTDGLAGGIAVVEPGGFLAMHRHAPAEIYLIMEGQGVVTIDGDRRNVGAGAVVFIPGHAEHGLRNDGTAHLKFFYVFPVGSFDDVAYVFS
jgi:quercetin dioxygenase-like cupin family protein